MKLTCVVRLSLTIQNEVTKFFNENLKDNESNIEEINNLCHLIKEIKEVTWRINDEKIIETNIDRSKESPLLIEDDKNCESMVRGGTSQIIKIKAEKIPVDCLSENINKKFPFEETSIKIEFDFQPIK